MNNKNSHKTFNMFITKSLLLPKKSLLLQEVNYKKQGRKEKAKRKLQKARKKANAKEKNLSEIYSKARGKEKP